MTKSDELSEANKSNSEVWYHKCRIFHGGLRRGISHEIKPMKISTDEIIITASNLLIPYLVSVARSTHVSFSSSIATLPFTNDLPR